MGADMPDTVRTFLRVNHHPARSVECSHCGAHAHRPCTTRSKRRLLTDAPVHPARVTSWARATVVCPTCQVEPGIPCHDQGWPQGDNHAARQTEAEETAA